MTKRRKSKKKRKSSKKNKQQFELKDGVGNQIVAVLLIVLALVLMAGWFTAEAGTNLLNDIARWLIGNSIYLAPAILIYLAVMIFRSEDHKLKPNITLGSIGVIAVLSGLFHLGDVDQQSFEAASDGLGGGVLGHVVAYPLNALFGSVTVIILIGLLLVMTSVMFNLKLSDMFGWLSKLKPDPTKKKQPQTTASSLEPKSRPTLNANVPLASKKSQSRSSFKDTAKKISNEEQHQDALTMSADPEWNFPEITLLNGKVEKADVGDWEANAQMIKETLGEFSIPVEMGDVNLGPRLTQYTLSPERGIKLNKITQLEQNIKMAMGSSSIRIEAPIPGKRAVGIEVPNKKSAMVRLRSIIESREWVTAKSPLSFALGQDISGEPVVVELDSMPHVLIAGQTGSGKSVMINTLLCSLLYRNAPSDMKLILVDPKQVELSLYEEIPHLLTPVISEPEKTISALKWSVEEMERRLRLMRDAGARNIASYNAKMTDKEGEDAMPYIVIVIDELADMMMQAARDVEALVVRLAAKARATGIHLVLATQRPSADVITGLIKANVPARIAFTVTQNVESRIILDQGGAEKLLGAGDMLYADSTHPRPRRIQGVFIDDDEVNKIVDHLKGEAEPDYNDDVISQPVNIGAAGGVMDNLDESDEDIYQEAVDEVVNSQKASISRLQRKFAIGYNRAARLVDMMEEQGIVGPSRGNRAREVLVTSLETYDDAQGDGLDV